MNGTPDLEKKKDMDSTFATELIRWVRMHERYLQKSLNPSGLRFDFLFIFQYKVSNFYSSNKEKQTIYY